RVVADSPSPCRVFGKHPNNRRENIGRDVLEGEAMARILIVEDEVALSDILRADLEAEGHTVSQAFDGPSALALVESQQPQLVILDWMLPSMDGLAVCRRIR